MAALALAALQIALQTAGGTGGVAEKHQDGEATGRHGCEPARKHHLEARGTRRGQPAAIGGLLSCLDWVPQKSRFRS